jgi:hypothetical protein
MMPEIAKLKPGTRRSLHSMLQDPEITAEVLSLLDKLTDNKSSSQNKR